jgi:hypothetical protein
MIRIKPLSELVKHHKFLTLFLVLGTAYGISEFIEKITPAKEVALVIGEPWKSMQERSTATLGDVIEGRHWYREPEQLSYLRFTDPEHEFITPPAKFFTVGFDNQGRIDSIRMSPQVKPLPIDDAIEIILDIQSQWKKNGWQLDKPDDFPAFVNDQSRRDDIQKCRSLDTFWHVKDRYSALIGIDCFGKYDDPQDQLYLITISMGKYIDYN